MKYKLITWPMQIMDMIKIPIMYLHHSRSLKDDPVPLGAFCNVWILSIHLEDNSKFQHKKDKSL